MIKGEGVGHRIPRNEDDLPFKFRRKMNLDDIVKLWYKTQMGNIHKCRENQFIFADIMWTLYNKLKEKND